MTSNIVEAFWTTISLVSKVIYTKVEQVGSIILAWMHSSSDIMQGQLDFSFIYVNGQLQQL